MKLLLTSALAAVLATTTISAAQDDAPTAGAETTTSEAASFVTPGGAGFSVAELLGEEVENLEGEEVGEVHDFLVEDSSTVTAIVISVGGFLGIGETYVAVDPDSLIFAPEDGDDDDWQVTIDTNRASLEDAPKFEYEGHWDQ